MGGDRIKHAVNLATQQVLHRRCAVLVRHVVVLGCLALNFEQFTKLLVP